MTFKVLKHIKFRNLNITKDKFLVVGTLKTFHYEDVLYYNSDATAISFEDVVHTDNYDKVLDRFVEIHTGVELRARDIMDTLERHTHTATPNYIRSMFKYIEAAMFALEPSKVQAYMKPIISYKDHNKYDPKVTSNIMNYMTIEHLIAYDAILNAIEDIMIDHHYSSKASFATDLLHVLHSHLIFLYRLDIDIVKK